MTSTKLRLLSFLSCCACRPAAQPQATAASPEAPWVCPETASTADEASETELGGFSECRILAEAYAVQEHRRGLERAGLLPSDEPDSLSAAIPCTFNGDFDGDGETDQAVWTRNWATLQPDLELSWGNGKENSRLAQGRFGHIDAAPGHRACALSTWSLPYLVGEAGTARVVHLANNLGREGDSRDALMFSNGRLEVAIFLVNGRWKNAIAGPSSPQAVEHWLDQAPLLAALDCAKAQRARANFLARQRDLYALDTAPQDILKSACEIDGDFDGDGQPDRIHWGASADAQEAGLFVKWSSGKWSQIGAGRPIQLDVPAGRPGCSGTYSALNVFVSVRALSSVDVRSMLNDDIDTEPLSAAADYLVATDWRGVEHVLAYGSGGWQFFLLPFDWANREVLLPYHEEWIRVSPPLEELQRYLHVKPLRRVLIEHNQPLPKLPPTATRGIVGNIYPDLTWGDNPSP